MNKALITFLILGLLFATIACNSTSKIADVKKDELLDKTVTVSGTVENTLKIRSVSGYKLTDSTGSIDVSSQTLPAINSTMTVTGVLKKSVIFGYYVLPNQ